MIRLTADFDLQIKDLARFLDPVEISDADGKLIGLFVPANLERGKQVVARLSANLDRTEIARRLANEKPCRTAHEVLQSLRDAERRVGTDSAAPSAETRSSEKEECVTS
jgi:hypothetical protein